ncbi:hypothetical protein VK66_12685 [Stenotrophomonas maltophilia]|nr:hypothetical protein VK66_12685 [Stenotrophomonas maltophilia]
MPARDPALIVSIARYGWVRGHQRYRLFRIRQQIRKSWVMVVLLAMIAVLALGVQRRPQDRNNPTCPGANVKGSNGLKAHALRERDDLWHGSNVDRRTTQRGTMKCSVFQGERHDLPSL